jgi:protein ImuB
MHAEQVGNWFFLDIATNASWIQRYFKNEAHLLESVLSLLSKLVRQQVRVAIADTPQTAQAFATQYGFWISNPGHSYADLNRLPLSTLLHLEGLEPWDKPTANRIESIVNFFALLGLQWVSDIRHFSEAVYAERWGQIGSKLFKNLQGQSFYAPQPISPFIPVTPLTSSTHLDFPVSMVSILIHEVETSIQTLFARLEGRRLVVRRMRVCLRCEYSEQEHVFHIEPSTPTRDLRFFKLLLENRLERIELLNPIKDVELDIEPAHEIETQDEFQNQASSDQTKIALLISLLRQEGAETGFAHLQDEILPEKSWRLETSAPTANTILSLAGNSIAIENDDLGYRPLFRYGNGLHKTPRPALLLRQPKRLSPSEVQALRIESLQAKALQPCLQENSPASPLALERIEHAWWDVRDGPDSEAAARDYFVARDQNGRHLWIFQDRLSEEFFLQGAFD